MKVLLDTNVILDIILQREPFFENAVKILKLSDTRTITSYMTANSVTDIYYIIRKSFVSVESRKKAVRYILNMVDIVGITKADVLKALDMDLADLEDALQTQCAKKIKADYIVTRNTKDFKDDTIRTVKPEEFLELF